jgi:hypothetical protein
MSLQDYAQRKYDYLALQNVKSKGDSLLGLTLFTPDTSGKICVGVQKLAQRWLLEFLTETGSMPGKPTRGCDFIRQARTGGFRTRFDIKTVFAASSVIVRRNLIGEEYAGMPDDERFSDASLIGFTVLPTYSVDQKSGTTAVYLNMRVKIISRAEDDYSIIFPIETLP